MKEEILRMVYYALISNFVLWNISDGIGIMHKGIEYKITIQEVKKHESS